MQTGIVFQNFLLCYKYHLKNIHLLCTCAFCLELCIILPDVVVLKNCTPQYHFRCVITLMPQKTGPLVDVSNLFPHKHYPYDVITTSNPNTTLWFHTHTRCDIAYVRINATHTLDWNVSGQYQPCTKHTLTVYVWNCEHSSRIHADARDVPFPWTPTSIVRS